MFTCYRVHIGSASSGGVLRSCGAILTPVNCRHLTQATVLCLRWCAFVLCCAAQASDAFSFGVVLWEVFCRRSLPERLGPDDVVARRPTTHPTTAAHCSCPVFREKAPSVSDRPACAGVGLLCGFTSFCTHFARAALVRRGLGPVLVPDVAALSPPPPPAVPDVMEARCRCS